MDNHPPRIDVFGALIQRPDKDLIEREPVKVKIIINTMEISSGGESASYRTSEVWSGELNILPKGEYLTKISIIADEIEHPICDVPFSLTMGYYQWIPPMIDNDRLEEIEEAIIENTEPI